jgi:hypothetical protein
MQTPSNNPVYQAILALIPHLPPNEKKALLIELVNQTVMIDNGIVPPTVPAETPTVVPKVKVTLPKVVPGPGPTTVPPIFPHQLPDGYHSPTSVGSNQTANEPTRAGSEPIARGSSELPKVAFQIWPGRSEFVTFSGAGPAGPATKGSLQHHPGCCSGPVQQSPAFVPAVGQTSADSVNKGPVKETQPCGMDLYEDIMYRRRELRRLTKDYQRSYGAF